MNLPDGDVEDVAADAARDRHVAEPLPRHDHASDQVRDARSGRQERQAHHLRHKVSISGTSGPSPTS